MCIKVEEAKHNEQIQMSMKNYMNTQPLSCPATYPLHHSGQLIIGVKETNHSEEIVKCSKEALFSIDRVMWFEMQLFLKL